MPSFELPPTYKQPGVYARGDHRICRTCYTHRVKCSKARPICAACKKSGRTCVWIENEPQTESQPNEDSSLLSINDAMLSTQIVQTTSEMAMTPLAANFYLHDNHRRDTNINTDSEPLSSIQMSLLEETDSQTLDTTIAMEDVNHLKRKLAESELDETSVETERARQIPDVAHMIGETETYMEDQNTRTATQDNSTRDTTLTPSSLSSKQKALTTAGPATIPAFSLTSLPPIPSHPNTSPSPASRISLIETPTIAEAASWFAKLLMDGNGIDMIEIQEVLGIRIYMEEELEAYQTARAEASAGRPEKQAVQEKDDDNKHDDVHPASDIKQNKDAPQQVPARLEPTVNPRHSRSHRSLASSTPTAPATIHSPTSTTSSRTYTLRLKHKGTKCFHGNRFYTGDGRPKTAHARRKLEEKDREGADDVVRMWD